MSKHKAKPLEQHLEDLSGEPSKFREKFQSIHYIYSKPLTEGNFKKHLKAQDQDFEIFEEKDEEGNKVSHGVLFYWETPIMTRPKTLGEFITVATALDRNLFWEEETWVKYIYINSKY